MEEFLGKKYLLSSSENFDEFLIELNVGKMSRTAASIAKPYIKLTRDGDKWTMTTKFALKTVNISFKLNEPFEEQRADGVMVESVVTLNGNVMTHVMKGSPETTVVREFGAEEMKATMTANNVVCTRIYKVKN